MREKSHAIRKTGFLALLLVLLFAMPVQAGAASIRLNTTKMSVYAGKTKTLKATVKGKSKKVTWKSSNTRIATVSKGKVTAKKNGKVTITAKANGKTASCTVTVWKNYKTLYRGLLAKSSVKAGNTTIRPAYFRILNINKSGVPELIVTEQSFGGNCTYYVYTVRSGAVKYLGECSLKGGSMIPTVSYSKKYKGIYVGGWINGVGGSWSALYGVSGTKLVRRQHAEEYHSGKDEYYTGTTDAKSNAVSRSTCAAFVKKYMGNLTKYELKANTEANRSAI